MEGYHNTYLAMKDWKANASALTLTNNTTAFHYLYSKVALYLRLVKRLHATF
jgi:hypothetical protein